MKKLSIFFIIYLSMINLINAQSNFAFLYSSAGMEYGKANTVDNDTNYINAALFQNTININPYGTTNFTAS
ncbi:MAG: hypothetical protein ACOYOV_15515, partial [Bacteroidales bacterium]